MVDFDIIEPVQKPTNWVSRLLVVEKPNRKLQVCLDPRSLNKAIKREHLHLPTAKEIFSQMSGVSYFSKLDASQVVSKLKQKNRVQIYRRLVLPQVDIVSNTYLMASIPQVKFLTEKLLQLFRTYLAVQIPKTTSWYGGKLYKNMRNASERFS